MAEQVPAVSHNSGSFASLLASFMGAGRADDSWDDSALSDDVASISYKQALHSVRRLRSARMPDSVPAADSASEPDCSSSECGKPRKSASITIRLSQAEQAQLRERAAEAKLSISAYLRSCIFEAETLRAQVKEVLSQMRPARSDTPRVSGRLQAQPHRRFLFLPWRH